MKKVVLWIILFLFFLIVFNVLFFMLAGNEHNASVWMSYAFIHFAYIMLILTPILVRKGKSEAIFGFSIFVISSVYFVVSFVVGLAFILIAMESYNIPLIVQVCLAGAYCIMLTSHLIANERTGAAEDKRQNEIAFVKYVSARLKLLMDQISDRDAKNSVEKVYNLIYSSPVKSHPSLTELENHIIQNTNELYSVIMSGDRDTIIATADSLLVAVNERNKRLKTLN